MMDFNKNQNCTKQNAFSATFFFLLDVVINFSSFLSAPIVVKLKKRWQKKTISHEPFCCLGEDLVPESPLQAEAPG